MTTWTTYFLEIAKVVSSKSKDTTKVGCVIAGEDNQILSTGWNGLPRGVKELPERLERPEKLKWTVHAEANAIANAARSGVSLKGSTLYCTHHPCQNCAGLIIQAGLKCVVFDGESMTVGDYGFDIAAEQFSEAGLELWMVP